jgi:hypothetical protein
MVSTKKFRYYLAFFIAVLTFVTFLPSLQNNFIAWDDNAYVYDNPYIRSTNMAFFRWAFLNFYSSNWHPLTWISHAVDYAVWGLNPMGHHLTNIILHSLNTFIVVILIMRLMESTERRLLKNGNGTFPDERAMLIAGGITGLLFGIHPLHVESVAWVSERKDLLCALFFLVSIITYAKHTISLRAETAQNISGPRFLNRYYLLTLGSFIFSLLSKPMAVTLPLVLLILDRYPFKRMVSLKTFVALLIEKVPFIALSLLSSLLTLLAQRSGGSIISTDAVPLSDRLLVGAKSLIDYLWKMIMPLNLMPFYPYPDISTISLFSLTYLLPTMLVTGITVTCMIVAKKQKLWLTLWGYYVITLLPVLGIIQVGTQSMADRYTYLPSLGPFLGMGLAVAWVSWKTITFKRWKPAVQLLSAVVAILVFVPMAYLTVKQIGIWKNSIVFWNYVIDREHKEMPLAYNNRGAAFEQRGQLAKAIADYNMAITLNRFDYKACNNAGILYGKKGEFHKAVKYFDMAIERNPYYYEAFGNRGLAYFYLGKYSKALEDFDEALVLNKNHDKTYVNRGNLYLKTGKKELARKDFEKACELGNGNGCSALKEVFTH